ncbi:hypothetical protein Tco_0357198 [Tanacetum coccineum]
MENTFEQPSTDQQPPTHRQEATTSQVKTLEVALKRKTKRVLLSDSEEEETEAQGRKTQDLDPLTEVEEKGKAPMNKKKEEETSAYRKDKRTKFSRRSWNCWISD